MARARNIKPGLFRNEVLGVADPIYTLLFEGLWLLADRAGRLEDRPLRIKGDVFPYRDGLDMNELLSWLERNGFIRRYQAGAQALIQILQFAKHQNPHKNEPPSELPGPDEFGPTPEEIGTTRADPGSRIPDSGLLDSAPPTDAKASKRKTKLPEDFEPNAAAVEKCRAIGLDLATELSAFCDHHTANGTTFLDWQAAFRTWLNKAQQFKRHGKGPLAVVQGPADPDSRSAIEAEGEAKGLGRWNEAKEQWHVYKARVRRGAQPSLGLEQLAAMAAGRTH